jgi:hypothetical protein
MGLTDERKEQLEAERWRQLADVVMTRWTADITPERNTGEPGGLIGVVIGVFEQRDDVTSNLGAIRAVVDRQAEDEALWSLPLERQQSIVEAYLQQELRHLHAVIEDYTKEPPSTDVSSDKP